jgi:hypothetical protein
MERQRKHLLDGTKVLVKHGELIPRGRRAKYLTSMAGKMRKLGLDPEIIRIALDVRAVQKCEDGKNFIFSHKSNLDSIAGWSADWREGDYFMVTLNGAEFRGLRSRHDRLVAAAKKFPDRITATDAYDRFEAALRGTKFTLNRNSGNHQDSIAKVRKETGFKVERPNGVCTWVRIIPNTING